MSPSVFAVFTLRFMYRNGSPGALKVSFFVNTLIPANRSLDSTCIWRSSPDLRIDLRRRGRWERFLSLLFPLCLCVVESILNCAMRIEKVQSLNIQENVFEMKDYQERKEMSFKKLF